MIRTYRPGDRDACLELFDSNVPDAFQEWEREGFARFLDELPGPFLVLEGDAGEVVGCGGVAVEDDLTGSLCWGIVRRDRQGQGLGRRLLLARMEELRREGCARVRLETIPETRGFFGKLGFRVVEIEPDGYASGMDRVVMGAELKE